MISGYNLSNLKTNHYQQDLDQFFSDCVELKKDYIDLMKTTYKPLSELEIVAIFDKVIKTMSTELIKQHCMENDFDRKLKGLNIAQSAKTTIMQMKPTIIMNVEKICARILNWKDSGLEEWLTAELDMMPTSQENLIEGEADLVIKFWNDCSEKWASKHGMEKYILESELDMRIQNAMNFYSVDCQLFAIFYLKVEENFFGKARHGLQEVLNFFREELKYNLSAKPKANDVIVYLDAYNNPVHFGVFVDDKRVCSKIGQMSYYTHKPESSFYGNSYIILSKSERG